MRSEVRKDNGISIKQIVFMFADEEMGYVDEPVDTSDLVEIVDRIMESRRGE